MGTSQFFFVIYIYCVSNKKNYQVCSLETFLLLREEKKIAPLLKNIMFQVSKMGYSHMTIASLAILIIFFLLKNINFDHKH